MAKILVIDDNEILLDTTSEILKINGHNVTAISDPKMLSSILSEPYDLLITDIIMPNIEGLEVILYAKEKYPELKAIAMTVKSSESVDILDVASGIGADATLKKPFKGEALIDKVLKVLS